MKNKDGCANFDKNSNHSFGMKDSRLEAMSKEIENLKTKISRMERANEVLWDTSVIKIIFKNEMIARKYRTKVEAFLKDTLETGEDFIVNCQIQENGEQVPSETPRPALSTGFSEKYVEQEYKEVKEVDESFHIDKTNSSLNEEPCSGGIPHYSSAFEDVLHCNDLQAEEKHDEEKETKPQVVTCFNCLGNHHMKQCPEEIDRLRINANKKEILLGNTMRYHVEEQKNSMKPGILSPELRNALGVKSDQLPLFIYHMRVLGYPPGWMDEAVLETSGISLYDVDGKDIKDGAAVLNKETTYDGTKFINYPGFNTATPNGINDEWETLKMPPIQPHQQLIEALKSPNTVNGINLYKRRKCTPMPDNDTKRVKNGVKEANASYSDSMCDSTPERNSNIGNRGSPNTPKSPDKMRHSLSVSISPGTPILKQGNPYERLPAADKFAKGITEHLPYENLPDAVGTFEKMRGVLCNLQKKMFDLDGR